MFGSGLHPEPIESTRVLGEGRRRVAPDPPKTVRDRSSDYQRRFRIYRAVCTRVVKRGEGLMTRSCAPQVLSGGCTLVLSIVKLITNAGARRRTSVVS